MTENRLIGNIVRQLREVLDEEIWLDENFQKKIGNLTDKEAFVKPSPQLHSVAELISHLVVWRRECIRRLNGYGVQLNEHSPENWRTNEVLKKEGWQQLKNEFYQSQYDLIKMIENQTDEYLENEYMEGHTFKYLLEGLIHHDFYHLGQIGITVKFLRTQS